MYPRVLPVKPLSFFPLLLLLALPMCGRPALAGTKCDNYKGMFICVGDGSYSIRFSDGSYIDGQCGSGVRRSRSVPFAVADSLHRYACNEGLEL